MQGRHLHTCAPPPGAEAKPSIPHQRMNSRSVLPRHCLPPQKSCSHRLPGRGAHANSRHSEGGRKPEGSKMESDREVIHLQRGHANPRGNQPLNLNHYATKKSVAESMLDVALFMSNATRLKVVLEQGPSLEYYTTLITLISLSLILQVVIGILLVVIGTGSGTASNLVPDQSG
ncbi:ninjurin-2 isoform X2 [Peromyscus californicus insignis]|uniref:ninjurin-2 isoform X2 n=1 Tax=Peromyscus californicus insignis TaxID=564181 RepID=UPI0022A7138F|nr:ninjurin-2 isoform X2 [Peromyscus californicus insignis]